MEYSEYRKYDGVALAEAIRHGELSAGEVVAAAIARAEAVNGRINAITSPLYELARKKAAAPPAGPLGGVPFLLKDLNQEWAGMPSGGGTRALRGVPATETAEVVRRWLDAGLIVLGRTNTPELGLKAITEPVVAGPARNPWALDRTPGGSSGGSAAAVAAGIVAVAAASDGGGSIRIPAGCCGVFGLKPGRGLLSAGPGKAEHVHGSSVDGVISRSVRDSAAALDSIVGQDPSGPYPAAIPERSFSAEVQREPGRLKIGFTGESAFGAVHPESAAALEDAAALLESLGHDVEPVSPPVDLAALAADYLRATSVNLAASIAEIMATTGAKESSFELDSRVFAMTGRSVRGTEYVATLQRWHEHTRRLAEFHQHYDLLLTPTLAGPPVRVGELATPPLLRLGGHVALALRLGWVLRRTGMIDKVARENLRHVPYTQLANLTGRPAMSVPLYWTPGERLPLGVQFVGGLRGEGLLFRLAAQLERARPWAHREPPL